MSLAKEQNQTEDNRSTRSVIIAGRMGETVGYWYGAQVHEKPDVYLLCIFT